MIRHLGSRFQQKKKRERGKFCRDLVSQFQFGLKISLKIDLEINPLSCVLLGLNRSLEIDEFNYKTNCCLSAAAVVVVVVVGVSEMNGENKKSF